MKNYLNRLGIKCIIKSGKEGIDIGKVTDMIDLFVQCQPAIRRKVCLKERTLKHNTNKVLSVEKTDQLKEMICLVTSTGTFIADGLSSHNCRKAQEYGYKIWVDGTVEVGHIGESVF